MFDEQIRHFKAMVKDLGESSLAPSLKEPNACHNRVESVLREDKRALFGGALNAVDGLPDGFV